METRTTRKMMRMMTTMAMMSLATLNYKLQEQGDVVHLSSTLQVLELWAKWERLRVGGRDHECLT
jgi:hypothetical protein